jgi:hypothetical protein
LASPTLNRLTAVLTQEAEDGPRWEATGLQREKIHHTGSIKFDPAANQEPTDDQLGNLRSILTELWGDLEDKHLILLGSSHAGEELAVAKVFAQMRADLPQLRLLLVPRHFERANEILVEFDQAGLPVEQRSAWPTRRHENADILLVDSTGELRTWYALVQAVIVGKSFLGEGGQNFLRTRFCQCWLGLCLDLRDNLCSADDGCITPLASGARGCSSSSGGSDSSSSSSSISFGLRLLCFAFAFAVSVLALPFPLAIFAFALAFALGLSRLGALCAEMVWGPAVET